MQTPHIKENLMSEKKHNPWKTVVIIMAFYIGLRILLG